MRQRERTPGPGAYNLDVRPITPSSPAYSIAGRVAPSTATEGQPGPGTYKTKPTFSSGPAYTIPGKPALTAAEQERKRVPGPGAYNVGNATDLVRFRQPAYTLGLRRRGRAALGGGPGPGAYTVPTVGTGPAHSMPGKRSAPLTPKSPGPGAYTPAMNRPGSPAYTMATRCRAGMGSRDQSPGPGQYDTRRGVGQQAPAYTIQGRWHSSSGAKATPGPGAYSLDLAAALTHQRDPAFTMSARLQRGGTGLEAGEGGPGPGAYSWRGVRGESGPAYTIAGRKLGGMGEPTPGPGAYESRPTSAAPAYSMAGRWKWAGGGGGPGPGSYNVKDTETGPAFSIARRRRQERGGTSPGPASYSLDLSLLHTSPPKFSMGTRYPYHPSDRLPGPGSYDPRLRSSAPAFSISSATPRFIL